MQLILILMAAAVQAAGASPQNPPAAEQPATELPEVTVTCRVQRVTGTRVVRKVCRSAEQLRQDDRNARIQVGMGSKVQANDVFKRPRGE